MSFPLLLQQQGVQLRSWHRIAPSRLQCRTCLVVRHYQLHSKPSPVIFGSGNYGSGILGNGGCCRWNLLKQQQQQRQYLQQPHQLYISLPIRLQQHRYLHLSTPEIDPRLQELTTLLSHPNTYHRPSSKTTSAISNIIGRRKYRIKLTALYESIRRDLDVWHELTSHQLLSLYKILRPSISDPSLSILLTNAQHVLQDIQQRTPQRFGILHVEELLSTYKAAGQVNDMLDLVNWADTKQLPLSLTAYESVISTLTTATKTTLTRNGQQHKPMDLALYYWDQVMAAGASSETTTAKLELMTGYMMQGFLAQGDLMRAATWLKTHVHSSNMAMQQVLDQWKTASSMGGDDRYYAVGVVSYGLEKLIQQAAQLDRYTDARLFYQLQCRLFSNSNSNSSSGIDNADASLLSGSRQQKQSTVGLLHLIERCMATSKDKYTALQQLLQDTLDLGHNKGTKLVAHRLLHFLLEKNKLRQALDVYFRLDTLAQERQLPRCFEMDETRLLLFRTAKAKYQTDMYRLYQRFVTLYPTSVDLRTYTHILQTLIRTKQYQEARAVFEDAIHNPYLLTSSSSSSSTAITGSSASTSAYTKRLFHLAYSLCAQVGDLALFKSTVDMQRKVGFPGLHHHALTSLMATYLVAKDTASAKAVFDHVAHQLGQPPTQPQQPQPQQSTLPISMAAVDSMDDYGDDNTLGGEQMAEPSDVDVVDFNLLMRTVRVEHDEYLQQQQKQQQQQQQQQVEPVAHRILDILRHMNLVSVPLNSTTLRTLLGVYAGQSHMEDEIFTTLLNSPQKQRHDEVWLNNLKLTQLLYGSSNTDNNSVVVDEATQKRRIKMTAEMFLSNNRQLLFPTVPPGTAIQANGMTYKILLDALTQYPQHASTAQRLFDNMRYRGWRPAPVIYEQMVTIWARKMRLQKVKEVMRIACDDLRWTDAPMKWYLLVLDRLVGQHRLDLAKAWILEIKKNEQFAMHRDFKQRLIKYGLTDSSTSSSSMKAASHQHHS